MKRIGVNVRLEVIEKTALFPVRKKEKRDMGPVVTRRNPLPRTINQAEHPA